MAGSHSHLQHSLNTGEWLELLDELNIGAFMADGQRIIRAINYTAQAIMEIKADELIGKDCRDIFTGVRCTRACVFSNEYNSLDGSDMPVTNLDENGRHVMTRFAAPVYDATGGLVGCLTILQDHSPIYDLIDRVHYEERSLKMTLDNLDVGIFTVNRGGLITFFNDAAERISGYSRKQLLGQHFSILFGDRGAKDPKLMQAAMTTGQPHQDRRGKIVDSGNVPVPINAKYLALKNEKGAIVGGLATFQDLTLVSQLSKAIRERYTFHDMIGKEPAMQKIFAMVHAVAASNTTILIEGPTGTGKDLLAKVIHSVSNRSKKPFVKINCAAIPDSLIESEMFGYVKGAFTGADRDKPGHFQAAAGGTIFLDEIGDLPMALQAKLLRVLEDREYYPLGSRKTEKVDVRIISATNRGLEEMVTEGLFRDDLFYRLNVMRMELPPLVDRRSDLPLLIRHIMRQLCAAKSIRMPEIAGPAMKILLNLDYPGNVRELENILEHALIICQNARIHPEHLPDYIHNRRPSVATDSRTVDCSASLDGHDDHRRILTALQQHNGNRSRAAQALGINRTTLWRKMKRHGIHY
jgi:PAS domain S-box-containing protein